MQRQKPIAGSEGSSDNAAFEPREDRGVFFDFLNGGVAPQPVKGIHTYPH